jgi:rhodanese-related sulfurtransferase
MKNKILGIITTTMIILMSISAIAEINKFGIVYENNITDISDEVISINLEQNSGLLGVDMYISNNGDITLNDVEWSFRYKAAISGTGIFILEKLQTGIISELNSGETISLKFRPFNLQTKSPIGFGNLYLNASAVSDENKVRIQKRAFLFSVFIINFRDTYKDISPAETYERWQNQEFDLIIDVVGLDIYSLGHLPGAVNYVWADGTLRSKIPDLDPNLTYLVYCHTDPPSTDSAQALVNAGITDVFRLEGNYAAWRDAGYPTEP